jgi:DNA repair exonuclease SbcCD ATPase subunit
MLGAAAGVVQATALKLHASKEQLQQLLETARQRLEAGQAPTEEAEMEWAALCRQQQTLDDLKQQREEVRAAGCLDCSHS